jgi:hypothetical protein
MAEATVVDDGKQVEVDGDTAAVTELPMIAPETMTDEQLEREMKKRNGEPSNEAEAETTDEGEATEVKTEESNPPAEQEVDDVEMRRLADKKAFVERQKAELAELDALIGRQSTEVSEKRKQALEQLNKEPERPQTPLVDPIEFAGKPREFDAYLRQIAKDELARRDAAENAARQTRTVAENQSRDMLTKKYPDFEKLIDGMAEVAKESGDTVENIAHFKANPYSYGAAVGNLLYIAAKAKADAIGAPKPAPKRVNTGTIGKIQGTATSTSKTTGQTAPLTPGQIPKMSREQLKSLLAKRR